MDQQSQVADKPLLMSLPDAVEAGQMVPVEGSRSGAERPKGGPGKGGSKATQFKPGVRTAGRQKGQPNRLTVGLREAVELATQPGKCHPDGFAGWLIERAHGGIEDRKIFAGVVSRVIPLQVEKKTEGVMRIELGWLHGRDVGRHLSQPLPIATQVIDLEADSDGVTRIKDPSASAPGSSEQG